MAGRKGFWYGSIVGGAIGAVAALLFAPKSGKELRQDITDQTHQAVNKTQEIASKVADTTHKTAETVQTKTKEWAQSVNEKTSLVVGKAKSTVNTVAEELRSLRSVKEEPAVPAEAVTEDAAESKPEEVLV